MHLFFHIGSPKAGSTSIQAALRRNAAELADQGILAWEPDGSLIPPARVLANAFVHAEKPLLPRERLHFATRAEATAWSEENWDRLAARIAADRPALTILSSESFFDMPGPRRVVEKLNAIFTGITVLAYIRDPVSQYRSMLDQRIRDGERFADLPSPLSLPQVGTDVIKRYRGLLGPENVVIRSFDRQNMRNGDLMDDFFGHVSAVYGKPVTASQKVGTANESLCAAATLWLMAANEAFIRFGQNDSQVIERRLELIRRLAEAPDLAKLPKLRDPEGLIADWVRHANRKSIRFFNAIGLKDQIPLKEAPKYLRLLEEEPVREAMREWLFSQLDAGELRQVLTHAVG